MKRLDLTRPGSVKAKRILVTGGTTGYGRALVLALLRAGAKVATCARGEEGLRSIGDEGAFAVQADVSRPGDVSALMTLIRAAWNGLDAVVNNAAILPRAQLSNMDLLDFKRALDVDLTGPWLVTREALEFMTGGNIVFVTSGLARFPMEPYNAYCVAKAGVNMLTRALSEELGPRFRVNACDPGVARTRMNPTAETPPEAAVPILRFLAALPPDGPTGLCFKKDGSIVDWDTTMGSPTLGTGTFVPLRPGLMPPKQTWGSA